MTDRITLEFDTPRSLTPAQMVERIADDMETGDDSGSIRDGDGWSDWRIVDDADGIDIDRRQRLAAAALMMGFDLPQEMMAASRSMLAAARLCPGMTTGDMAPMGTQGRRHALQMAKGLIDEMLAEPDEGDAPDDGVQVLRVFRLPVELDEKLRRIALNQGTTFEKLVVKAVADAVARERGQ